MNDIDAITEKLRKILTLAADAAAHPGEAEAALARAKEMALKYNIELASIALNKGNGSSKIEMEVQKHQLRVRSMHPQKYHRWIYAVLHQVFDIRVITCGSYVYFVGEKVDVLICIELFPWLEHTFRRTYTNAKKEAGIIACAADKNGVYRGLYYGMVEANKREKEKLNTQEKQCMALVVRNKEEQIDAKVKEEFPNLKDVKSRAQQINWEAVRYGEEKGKQINLRQTGAGTKKGQLE